MKWPRAYDCGPNVPPLNRTSRNLLRQETSLKRGIKEKRLKA